MPKGIQANPLGQALPQRQDSFSRQILKLRKHLEKNMKQERKARLEGDERKALHKQKIVNETIRKLQRLNQKEQTVFKREAEKKKSPKVRDRYGKNVSFVPTRGSFERSLNYGKERKLEELSQEIQAEIGKVFKTISR